MPDTDRLGNFMMRGKGGDEDVFLDRPSRQPKKTSALPTVEFTLGFLINFLANPLETMKNIW